ncbi:MAG: hypothetical protein QNI92_03375 [Desulfobacterales bacterium]|nr:hypothetical protein [Desulfobacterales bacterium]MDJ0915272.1 hypothetical protein [Desulfobacterales bacterium]
MISRICRVCGDEFHVPPKKATAAYCFKTSCQVEKRQRRRQRDKERYRLVQKGIKKVRHKKKPDEGRRCRRCQSNCYPNYFYCPECHQIVSNKDWFSTKDDEVSACSL